MTAAQDSAPVVIRADRVYAAGRQRPARAVATCAGRVVAVGTPAACQRAAGGRPRVVDLRGCCVTAGLIDAHTHYLYWALSRRFVVDLSAADSLAACVRLLKQRYRRTLNGWLLGRGFAHTAWSDLRSPFPTAHDLDRDVPDVPVMARSRDGHSVWLNTAGMRAAGITSDRTAPSGGTRLRDERGAPTGIVQEAAIDLLPDPLRDFARRSDAKAVSAIDVALDEADQVALGFGITGVHSMDDGASLAQLQRRRSAGTLGLRVVHAVQLSDLPAARQVGLRSGFGDDWLRIGAVKIFSDGALGSQTAYMFEPYAETGSCGVPVVAGAELREVVVDAARVGLASWIHAIGDRAVHEAAQAIRAARRAEPVPLPHRIEHAQCVRPRDVRAMARAGIIASMQPCHLPGDIENIERHWFGVRQHAFCFRRLLDAGVSLALGSDVPIESIDPRRSFHAAIARPGRVDAEDTWGGQRMTPAEVLRGFTVGAAQSTAGAHPLAGQLTVGAPADLTAWGCDPMRVDRDAWPDAPLVGAMVGGRMFLR